MQVYNTTHKMMQFCNGDDWIAMTSEGQTLPPICDTGYILVMGGENWECDSGADTEPDAFSFTDQTNVSISTLTTSNTIVIAGIDSETDVSVSGDGSPQIRINGGSWVTSGTITNGQSLEVRLTSSGSHSTALSATVNVGGVTDNWSVTTVAADTTPDAFSFTDQTNVAISTLTTSNSVTINGINTSTSVSVSGDGSPQIRINGGSWTTSGSITNGQTLEVRLTSSGSYSTALNATVTVGSGSDNWSVTTLAADTTPDAFSFTDQTDVATSTLTTSNSITINGINSSTSVSVSGSGSPQIRINGGSWVTSGTITNGQTLQVRLTSAASVNTVYTATVNVGGITDSWSVDTETKAITYLASAANSGSGSSYTFSSVSIGSAFANRRIIVFGGRGGSGGNITGVTIGGVSATEVVSLSSRGIYIAHVPTGTTANIVFTLDGSASNFSYVAWSASGLTSNTPYATFTDDTSPTTGSISTHPTKGFIVAGASMGSAASSVSWTNLTERFDSAPDGYPISGADAATVGGGSVTITASPSGGSPSNRALVAASW